MQLTKVVVYLLEFIPPQLIQLIQLALGLALHLSLNFYLTVADSRRTPHLLLDLHYCQLISCNEIMLGVINHTLGAECFHTISVPAEVFYVLSGMELTKLTQKVNMICLLIGVSVLRGDCLIHIIG
jgi:hypothetical protein